VTALEVLAWLPAAAWVYLILFRGWFWHPAVRLPGPLPHPAWPAVAVVVPARDEADLIARTLPSLLMQDYPGPADVYVVDDASRDGTGAIARSLDPGRLTRHVLPGAARPPGWVGKTWALHQGMAAALDRGCPEWILFTDADIAHPPDSLRRLVSAGLSERRDLVSLMARLRTDNRWEKLIVPAFVYFFSQLYPFRQVARRPSRTAAAAGGCVLVRTEALLRAGGVAAIAGEMIDDVALGRAVKRTGGSIWLGYADRVESLRPYPHLADLWDMVARSAYTQLRRSLLALAGTVAGLTVIYLGPPAVTVAGLASANRSVTVAGAAAWTLLTLSYVPMLAYYRIGLQWSLTLPVAAALYGAMTVDSARRHWRGHGAVWKGRTYSHSGAGRPEPRPADERNGPPPRTPPP
jgi:hopene-associated glycosyltransferase HpnB